MSITNEIFVRTAKAERESTKLSDDLKRVLSFMDGQSRSGELAKRAAPSLRKIWDELIQQLVKEGYIVPNRGANINPKDRLHPKGAVASANDLDYRNMFVTERVIAELEAAAAADKAKLDLAAKTEAMAQHKIDLLSQRTAAADKAKSELEAKAKADTQLQAEKAAHARAELLAATAAAAAREMAEAEAKSKAELKRREQKNARTYAELEMAILASKARSDIEVKAKSELQSKSGMNADNALRLRDLEIKNATLKKLLVDAYLEIGALKSNLGTKQ